MTANTFWQHVNKGKECWTWVGSVNSKGYGRCWFQGRHWRAHRAAYALTKGVPLAGMDIDHLCGNRSCVNPAHLEMVTHRENLRRVKRKSHCGKGHEFTPENTYHTPPPHNSRRCRQCQLKISRDWKKRRRYANPANSSNASK